MPSLCFVLSLPLSVSVYLSLSPPLLPLSLSASDRNHGTLSLSPTVSVILHLSLNASVFIFTYLRVILQVSQTRRKREAEQRSLAQYLTLNSFGKKWQGLMAYMHAPLFCRPLGQCFNHRAFSASGNCRRDTKTGSTGSTWLPFNRAQL